MGRDAIARCHGRFFSLSVTPLPLGRHPLFACVVSKKVASKAVQRNRIKRHFREVVRVHIQKGINAPPLVFVFRAKVGVSGTAFADVFNDIGGLIDKMSNTRYNASQ